LVVSEIPKTHRVIQDRNVIVGEVRLVQKEGGKNRLGTQLGGNLLTGRKVAALSPPRNVDENKT